MIEIQPLDEKKLVNDFEKGILDPSLFTHYNQLHLCWIYLHKYSLEEATSLYCMHKENYYINTLGNNKFNLPLTKAYVEIVAYFIEKSGAKNFEKLLREFPRLQYSFKDLVKTHYGFDILKEHRNEDIKPLGTILFTF